VFAGDTRYVFREWGSGLLRVESPLTLYKVYGVQYRVRVEAGEGRACVEEGEWIDEGSVVTVKVESVRFGFPVQIVLDRFYVEGGSVVEQDASTGWVRVLVDKPTTVYVLWRKDYTLLYAIIAVAAAAAGSALLVVKRGLPVLTGKAVAAVEEREVGVKREAPPTAARTEIAAAQPAGEGTLVVKLEYLESELAKLVEEARKHREYLEKLEAAKAEGKVSETAYDKLKEEYSEKIKETEKKIRELEEAKKKLEKER